MPELPEVETVRRCLAAALEGRVLARVVPRRAGLRVPLPADMSQRLAGRRVLAVGRRAKYLLVDFEGGETLIVHLGMTGRFRIFGETAEADVHDHVIFQTADAIAVHYHDTRRFGLMTLCRGGAESHPLLSKLGVEPLGNEFSGAYLTERLAGRKGPLKPALMDQSVVAGMGNIYASESLFRAGLSPRRQAGSVGAGRAQRLARAIREVFAEAIAAGGTTISDHRLPSGEEGNFRQRLAVYARAGQPCPGCDCDLAKSGGVARIVQSGRATFYCAKGQR